MKMETSLDDITHLGQGQVGALDNTGKSPPYYTKSWLQLEKMYQSDTDSS